MADATQIRITAVDATTAAFRSVQGNISRMTNTLRGVAGPLAAAFSVAAITGFSRQILQTADNLAKLSQKTGVTVEDLSAFQLSADLAGVSSESFSAAMVRLNRSIADATGGAKLQTEAFNSLGISQEELAKLSPTQVLEKIADSFANAEDGANKTQIAMNLLGRAGADLIPLLNGGSSALRQFGSTVSTEFAKNAEIFNDNLRILQENLTRFAVNVLGPVISSINNLFGTPAGNKLDESIDSARQRVEDLNFSISQTQQFGKDGLFRTKDESIEIFKGELKKAQEELDRLLKLKEAADAQFNKPKQQGFLPPVSTGVTDEDRRAMELAKEIREVYESTARPVDVLNYKLNRLNELKAMGVITDDAYLDRMMQIQEEYQNTVPKIELNDNALRKYAESARDLRTALDNAAVRGLQNLEDSLLQVYNGTMTVKDAFRNMAISIINDLLRIQIQQRITGPIASALGGLFGGGTQSPAPIVDRSIYGGQRALGGTASVGKAYMVGEKGPEMFIPGKTGVVVPNNQLGGSGAVVNQTINISTGVSQTVRAEVIGLMPQIMESTKAAVLDAKRRGGTFGKAFA